MPRTFPVSLAEAFPSVAATWHPTRNGSLTPDRVGTGGPMMWWLCPAGHEWEETVISRRSLPKWKAGDVAACKECVGFKTRRVFPGCGCVKTVRIGTREAEHARCYACRTREFEENAPRVKVELSAAAKAAAGRAGELLGAVRLPDGMPEGLAVEWRYWAAKHLQYAIAGEQVLGKAGETSRSLERVTVAAERAVPSLEACAAAALRDGVLNIFGRAYWAEGWWYALGGETRPPLTGEQLAVLSASFLGALEGWAEHWPEEQPAPVTTAEVTRALTEEVRECLQCAMGEGARVYAEVRVPVVPDGKGRYGRVDLLGWRPEGFPPFVVEIDSRPNPSSVRKLTFARDAGAVPVWVRFGSGPVEDIDGVAVVDARALVHPLTARG
ncbi:zinc-ribbon domain-containing protein [Streptomyces sp. NPDC091682]|uniref:zinc-ribbon domain-containing protein n=1 Tax=Streptomyces sp. NPDC091682 TaxID=3366005 RepID=UPI0038128C84